MKFLLLLAICLVAGSLPSQAAREENLSPYFLVQGGSPGLDRFPLKSTRVDIKVNGVIAGVVVTQTYSNEGTRPIHARYVFPGSTRSAVHGLSIRVGDQVVVARIEERRVAKQEFETARALGKTASLLEQQRPNVFTMNVANIMPGDVVIVELGYTELLVPSEGIYEIVYPTVVAPRYVAKSGAEAPVPAETGTWTRSPYVADGPKETATFDIEASLSTGLPLQDVHCGTHDVDLSWEGRSSARVTLARPGEFGGDRDFILKYRLAGEQIESGLVLYEGEEENFFLLMVQPPERVQASDITPREYIFVIDVSGSMNGFPLDTARSLIDQLLGSLRESDLFNVMHFAGSSHLLSPASLPATRENITQAMMMIENERGGGGTEILPALTKALGLPTHENFARSVIVITDGLISVEQQVFALIRDNLDRTSFFSFGIGSSVNRHLVEGIASAGLGEPFIVTTPAEAPTQAHRFRSYIDSPLLTQVHVSFRGFQAFDVEPAAVPDLFARRPLVIHGKWRGKRTGEIEVTGWRPSGPFVKRFRVAEMRPSRDHEPLRYLWARKRIERLSDYGLLNPDPDRVGEITSLGLTYSLLTRYTSFIAVLETVRNPDRDAANVDQPLTLAQGLSPLAVGGGYGVGPEPAIPILLIPVVLALSILWIRRKARLETRS